MIVKITPAGIGLTRQSPLLHKYLTFPISSTPYHICVIYQPSQFIKCEITLLSIKRLKVSKYVDSSSIIFYFPRIPTQIMNQRCALYISILSEKNAALQWGKPLPVTPPRRTSYHSNLLQKPCRACAQHNNMSSQSAEWF